MQLTIVRLVYPYRGSIPVTVDSERLLSEEVKEKIGY